MVAFFPRHISAWMDGTEPLSDGEYRVYDVICNLIYLNDGPVVMNERGFAGRCNQHVLAFRSHLKKLMDKGKLAMTPDGKLTNRRVESELKKIGERKAPKRQTPPPTPRQPPAYPPRTSAQPHGGHDAKPLKNQDPTLFPDDVKKRKESTIEPNGSIASAEILDERTRLFREGLATLQRISGRPESRCRSLVSKFLQEANEDALLVRRVIEDADHEKPIDPVPWIFATIKKRLRESRQTGPASQSGGKAALSQRYMQNIVEERHGTTHGSENDEGALPAEGSPRGRFAH